MLPPAIASRSARKTSVTTGANSYCSHKESIIRAGLLLGRHAACAGLDAVIYSTDGPVTLSLVSSPPVCPLGLPCPVSISHQRCHDLTCSRTKNCLWIFLLLFFVSREDPLIKSQSVPGPRGFERRRRPERRTAFGGTSKAPSAPGQQSLRGPRKSAAFGAITRLKAAGAGTKSPICLPCPDSIGCWIFSLLMSL